MSKYEDDQLTRRIIGCAYQVHNELGSGLLEKVYRNSLAIALAMDGIAADVECPINVYYCHQVVGEYYADVIADGRIIIELKAVTVLKDIHELQLKNYLKATGMEIGLLINFGESVEVRRKFVPKELKTSQ